MMSPFTWNPLLKWQRSRQRICPKSVFTDVARLQDILGETNGMHQVLPGDLFGCFKWPFQGLSDLHLGYQRVTWKKLAGVFFGQFRIKPTNWFRIPSINRFGELMRNSFGFLQASLSASKSEGGSFYLMCFTGRSRCLGVFFHQGCQYGLVSI